MNKKFIGGVLAAIMALTVGCSSSSTKELAASKNIALPDFVKSSPAIVQDTYVLAAEYPEVLKDVPCYCGCGVEEGHKSNLDCFVKNMGPDKKVLAWDPMGIS